MAVKKPEKKIIKNTPTIYPNGFSMKYAEDENNILVIDFFDDGLDNTSFCVGSFAMSPEFYINLKDAISEIIETFDKGKKNAKK